MEDTNDCSYWTPPGDTNKIRLKVVEALCTDCFNEITEGYFNERVHGKQDGPKFIKEWQWGDPRTHDDLNPLYNPKVDIKTDWREGVNLRQFNHFYQYSKWTYGRDCSITVCDCALKKKEKGTDYMNIFAIDATEKVSNMQGGRACHPVEVVPTKPSKKKKKKSQNTDSDDEDYLVTKSTHLQQDGKSVSTHMKFEPKPVEPMVISQKKLDKMKKSGKLWDSDLLRGTEAKDMFQRLISDPSAEKKKRAEAGLDDKEDTRIEKIIHVPRSFLLQAAVTGSKLDGQDEAVAGGYKVMRIADDVNGGEEIIINTASLQAPVPEEEDSMLPGGLPAPPPKLRWKFTEEFLRRKFDDLLPVKFEWQESPGWAAAVFDYTQEEQNESEKPTNFRLRMTCKEEQRLKWLMVHMIDYVVKRKKRKCPGWVMDENDILTCMLPDSAAIWEGLCIRIQKGVNTEELLPDYKPFVLTEEEKTKILDNCRKGDGSLPTPQQGAYQVVQDYDKSEPIQLSDLQKVVAKAHEDLKEKNAKMKAMAWRDFYKAARENLPGALDVPRVWLADTEVLTDTYTDMCSAAVTKITQRSIQEKSETTNQYVDKYLREVNEAITKLVCEYITGERVACPQPEAPAEGVNTSLRPLFAQICLILQGRESEIEQREMLKGTEPNSVELPSNIHGSLGCFGKHSHGHVHHHHHLLQRCGHCHKPINPSTGQIIKTVDTQVKAAKLEHSDGIEVGVASDNNPRPAAKRAMRRIQSNETGLDNIPLNSPNADSSAAPANAKAKSTPVKANSSTPTATIKANLSTSPATTKADSSTPPAVVKGNSSTPPATAKANSTTPPVTTKANSSTPPVTANAESSTPPATTKPDSSPPIPTKAKSSTSPATTKAKSSSPPATTKANSSTLPAVVKGNPSTPPATTKANSSTPSASAKATFNSSTPPATVNVNSSTPSATMKANLLALRELIGSDSILNKELDTPIQVKLTISPQQGNPGEGTNSLPSVEFLAAALKETLPGIKIKSVMLQSDTVDDVKSTGRQNKTPTSKVESSDKPDILSKVGTSLSSDLASSDRPDILKKVGTAESSKVRSSAEPDLLKKDSNMPTPKVGSSKPDILVQDGKTPSSKAGRCSDPDILERDRGSQVGSANSEKPKKAPVKEEAIGDDEFTKKCAEFGFKPEGLRKISSDNDMMEVMKIMSGFGCNPGWCSADSSSLDIDMCTVTKGSSGARSNCGNVKTEKECSEAKSQCGDAKKDPQVNISTTRDDFNIGKIERKGSKDVKKSGKKTDVPPTPSPNLPNTNPSSPDGHNAESENSNGKKKLKTCARCGKEEPSLKTFKKCQKCQALELKSPRYYCGRDCQVVDWTERHKAEHKNNLLT